MDMPIPVVPGPKDHLRPQASAASRYYSNWMAYVGNRSGEYGDWQSQVPDCKSRHGLPKVGDVTSECGRLLAVYGNVRCMPNLRRFCCSMVKTLDFFLVLMQDTSM